MGGKWVTGRAGETRVVNVGVGLVGDDLAFIYKFNFLSLTFREREEGRGEREKKKRRERSISSSTH